MITSLDDVYAVIDKSFSDEGRSWLADAVAKVEVDPSAIRTLFPAAGRSVGRDDIGDLTAADAARIMLLEALGDNVEAEIPGLYRYGDAGERLSILHAYNVLLLGDGIEYIRDALRSNDIRLVSAALGEYGLTHLDDTEVYNAVLKCIFMEIPLAGLPGLERRVTPELSRMVASFVHERVAAGRDVSPDVWPVIDAHPPEAQLQAIEAELLSDVDDRRHAAKRALALRSK